MTKSGLVVIYYNKRYNSIAVELALGRTSRRWFSAWKVYYNVTCLPCTEVSTKSVTTRFMLQRTRAAHCPEYHETACLRCVRSSTFGVSMRYCSW
jgi:hypothetical protein